MTTPDDSKTLRVSPETHAMVMSHARHIRGTVDEAVRDLGDPSTVRVPLSGTQRARWEAAAGDKGVRLGDYVRLLVEAGMTFDPLTVHQIFYRVDALHRAAGIGPAAAPQQQEEDRT